MPDRRSVVWRAVFFAAAAVVLAADDLPALDWWGYYENQANIQLLESAEIVNDSNKLRLDIAQDLGRASFGGDLVFHFYAGDRTVDLTSAFSAGLARSLDARVAVMEADLRIITERFGPIAGLLGLEIPPPGSITDLTSRGLQYSYENRIYADNLFVKISAGIVDVTVGKQQLPWGTGYVWNPTDIFNAKNVFDPAYEKEGVTALKVTVNPMPMMEIKGVVAYLDWSDFSDIDTDDEPALGFRVKGFAGGFDFSASYLNRPEMIIEADAPLDEAASMLARLAGAGWLELPGLVDEAGTMMTSLGEGSLTFPTVVERRHILGADMVGEVHGVGVWMEGAYNRVRNDREWWEVTTGTDYTFDFETHVLAEYYYNGRGRLSSGEYRLDDWLALFSDSLDQIGRHYIFLGGEHPITDLATLGLFGIMNATDGSTALMADCTYSLMQDVELKANAIVTAGDDDSELGVGRGSFWIRLTAYF